MKKRLICLTVLGAIMSPGTAETIKEEWKVEMGERLDRLEERLQQEQGELEVKNRRIEELEERRQSDMVGERERLFRGIELGGLIEVEATHVSPDGASDSSDINVTTVELGLISKVNEWVGAEILLLYEEQTDNDGELNIDTAMISLADPSADWFVKAGRGTLPFGIYDTRMISDPITLELGETNDTAVEVGYRVQDLNAAMYLFQGDHSDKMDNLGVQLGYGAEVAGYNYNINLGFLNNLAESNAIVDEDWVSDNRKRPAWTLSVVVDLYDDWSIVGEYLRATKAFADASDERPSAFNMEGAYSFETKGMPASLALGYQGSNDASDANWSLPEKRFLVGFALEVLNETHLEVEYRRDEAYSGARSDSLTGQIAIEF